MRDRPGYTSFIVRMPMFYKARLKRIAAAEDRSMSSCIREMILKAEIVHRKKGEKSPDGKKGLL